MGVPIFWEAGVHPKFAGWVESAPHLATRPYFPHKHCRTAHKSFFLHLRVLTFIFKSMKKLLLVAILALGSISAHAALLGAPFLPEIDCRFNALETGFISPGCIGSVGPSLKSIGIFGIVPENICKIIS